MPSVNPSQYRGRIAPSPTGYLHLGHARTFWTAQERTLKNGGVLILRNEDLDPDRCSREFALAMMEDLRWFGFQWQEGPDSGGPCAPYSQSERMSFYADALRRLREAECVYPCSCSRRDVQRALQAPHQGDEEPVYPGTCRPERVTTSRRHLESRVNWRFRVPDGEAITFADACLGEQSFVAGRDFGDFVIWRHDGVPSYQLAATVDDAAMQITEVVRGSDLLVSTARQLLIYRALKLSPPTFCHCPLVTDEHGVRLAKRHDALSLRTLRQRGISPQSLRDSVEFCRC